MATETIIGAGPVGLSLALMRAKSGAHVTLIDKTDLATVSLDARSLAISYGSVQILNLKHIPHAPIQHIHISEHGAWGHTQLHAADVTQPMLGMVVRYGDLVAQLSQLAESQPNIRIIRPASVVHIDGQQVTLNDGQIIDSDLIVHAEGSFEAEQLDYQQTALIANVTLAKAKPAWAWERFTAHGPCALLPASNDGLNFNLVWCVQRARADELMAATDNDFLAQINHAVRHLTGTISQVGPRVAYPLGLKRAAELYSGARVAIGNAAQTLHPVAGQGFNLGLRDAFVLNQSLNQHLSIVQALSAFTHHRQLDRAVTVRTTDALARGFFTDFGVAHVRSAGFGLINALPLLKRKVAQQFMFGVR